MSWNGWDRPDSGRRLSSLPMQLSETVQCPFCGQDNQILVEGTFPSQRFITDCEVCCRPFEVLVECEAGEILSLDVRSN